jgi:starch phosphorylase
LDPLPPLPDRIRRLGELAHQIWWTWNEEGRRVFRQLDYKLWRETHHNPVRMLRTLAPARLEELARDEAFLSAYDTALAALDAALADGDGGWGGRFPSATPIAYVSAEFAFHQSLPIYAGGLGVLAGDHCKEASDLGLPLVGVGFMYPQGYFHQKVSERGQEESYETIRWADMPVEAATKGEARDRVVVEVPLAERIVRCNVWRLRVGRVSVYLLDTHHEANASEDRALSARLYGGSMETRLHQEIVLGIGAVRVLRALGIEPGAWHLNEGHAAFVSLERLREALGGGAPFEAALEAVRRTTAFTTHTPVAAGHDVFPLPLVDASLAGVWAGGPAREHRDALLALGAHDAGHGPAFSMTVLALRTATRVSAVSRRHGEVASRAWGPLVGRGAEGKPGPFTAITNGVHVAGWLAPDLAKLFDRWLGREWRARQDEEAFWERLADVPDEELWRARGALRGHLFSFLRERARQLWTDGRGSASRVAAAGVLLDPEALTVGYARRFTGYKRPELVFHDEERLVRILQRRDRPVQIVFAGKAHPADHDGKEHLRRVFARALDPRFGGRIAFLEDYDMHVAHFLVQGCDVWLNTPRAPLEASGTSGMKAAINGVPHLSVGDGWWAEGYTGTNGWLIQAPPDPSPSDPAAADGAEAGALYRLLEEEVVPSFFDRDGAGVPRRWLEIVRAAIRSTLPRFCARRMVKQYALEMYAPALG